MFRAAGRPSNNFNDLKEIDIDQEVTIVTSNRQYSANSSTLFTSATATQPYRFGGRVGLFGHYLRALKIILLLTCIKLDASTTMPSGGKKPSKRNNKATEHLLKLICELASNIEAVERLYVKKGQRLLFCGPEIMDLGPKCTEIQLAFDSIKGNFKNTFIH